MRAGAARTEQRASETVTCLAAALASPKAKAFVKVSRSRTWLRAIIAMRSIRSAVVPRRRALRSEILAALLAALPTLRSAMIVPQIPCKGLMNQLGAFAEVIAEVSTCMPLCNKQFGILQDRHIVLPPFHTACYHWDPHDNMRVDFSEWFDVGNFTATMHAATSTGFFVDARATAWGRQHVPRRVDADKMTDMTAARKDISAALNISQHKLKKVDYNFVKMLVRNPPGGRRPRNCYPSCNCTTEQDAETCQFEDEPEPARAAALRKIYRAFYTALAPGRFIRPFMEPLQSWLQVMLPPGSARNSYVSLHLRFEELSGTRLVANAVKLFGYAGGRQYGLKNPARIARLMHHTLGVPPGSLVCA